MKAAQLLPRLLPLLLTLCLGGASAMTPGPTRFIQCPGSDEVRRVPSIGSGNTFGARFWTDGFMLAPMLPEFPAITRCSPDGPIFWVSSAKVMGETWPWRDDAASVPAGWRQAPVVRPLSGDELLQAVAQGLGDTPAKLAYLRRQAWWAANQARRSDDPESQVVASSDFAEGSPARANLEALVAACDETQADELLFKAEGLRELARFDEAEQLLKNDKLKEPRMQAFVETVRARTALRDARVARVKTEP